MVYAFQVPSHARDKASGNRAAEDLSLLDPDTWHTIGSYLGPRVVSSNVEGPCPLAGGLHVALCLPFQSILAARATWPQAQSGWARAPSFRADVARMSWERKSSVAVYPEVIKAKVGSVAQICVCGSFSDK